MADYIFIRKSRNALSSLIHGLLNLLLAVVSIGATVITGNFIIGLILVVISKWRVFAVNHRYWLLNLRSSLVDFIVGTSFVLLAYAAGTSWLPVQFLLMAGYTIWLILIKPRSSTRATIAQAIIAVFLGTATASIFAAITTSITSVLATFVIGYAASNHVLAQTDEAKNTGFLSLVTGLVFAEVAWLSHTWLIFYPLGTTGICIPQLSIILSLLAFVYFKIITELQVHQGKLKFMNVALPVLFSLLVIMVLIIGFSQPRFNIH